MTREILEKMVPVWETKMKRLHVKGLLQLAQEDCKYVELLCVLYFPSEISEVEKDAQILRDDGLVVKSRSGPGPGSIILIFYRTQSDFEYVKGMGHAAGS